MSQTLTPMSPERHQAIRALLVSEAGRTSSAVPTTGFVRRPVVRRTGFALLATAAAVSATVLATGDPSAPPDYGSWTAMPETGPGLAPPPSDDIQRWTSQCTDLTGSGLSIEGVTSDPDAAGREVLVDRRGEVTFCLDVTPGSGTVTDPLVALAGVASDVDSVSQGQGIVYDRPLVLPAGEDVLLLAGPSQMQPAPAVESALGAAGADVTGIEVRLTDGTRITATVQSGLWAAWWPTTVSTAGLAELVVTTGAGKRTVDPKSVSLDWDRDASGD